MKEQSHAATIIANPAPSPLRINKIERNKPCPCGSGKKAKYCCGTEAQYYNRVRKPKDEDHV